MKTKDDQSHFQHFMPTQQVFAKLIVIKQHVGDLLYR